VAEYNLGKVKIGTMRAAVFIMVAHLSHKWQGLTFAQVWFLRFIVHSLLLAFVKPFVLFCASLPLPLWYQFISTEFSFSVMVPDGGCHS